MERWRRGQPDRWVSLSLLDLGDGIVARVGVTLASGRLWRFWRRLIVSISDSFLAISSGWDCVLLVSLLFCRRVSGGGRVGRGPWHAWPVARMVGGAHGPQARFQHRENREDDEATEKIRILALRAVFDWAPTPYGTNVVLSHTPREASESLSSP